MGISEPDVPERVCNQYLKGDYTVEKWTQKELEELYKKVNEMALSDPEFRKELMADQIGTLEKIAGRKLPEGFQLRFVEGENAYAAAYVLPNFTGDEIDLKGLQSVAGGSDIDGFTSGSSCKDDVNGDEVSISIALIVSVCAAAGQIGGCSS